MVSSFMTFACATVYGPSISAGSFEPVSETFFAKYFDRLSFIIDFFPGLSTPNELVMDRFELYGNIFLLFFKLEG